MGSSGRTSPLSTLMRWGLVKKVFFGNQIFRKH